MRKIATLLIVIILVVVVGAGMVACDEREKLTIVFLGDSIAEGLIGTSPVSQRDNYGYYAIIGKVNGFNYYNHAVSGHKTSTGMAGSDGLLEMLLKEDENASLMKSHIENADILHISILGNNMLQYDLGLLLVEIASSDFQEKYDRGESLLNALHDGGVMYRQSLIEGEEDVEFDFPNTYQNICDIVARLKSLNPDARIIFQKVYNPVYDGTTLLDDEVKDALANIIDDGRFGDAGKPISTIYQIRNVAQALLDFLNGMLDEYLQSNPNAFTVLDVNLAFHNVTNGDKNADGSVNLSSNCIGAKLLFKDWTHPSNFGHAVVAAETQRLLEKWGVADKNALANYKSLKISQLDKMYKDVEGFDYEAAVSALNEATTFMQVNYAYFGAIEGYTPINY